MNYWKMPPRAKIYEALSVLADQRVILLDENSAEVRSSSGRKSYRVEWTPDLQAITANDNASYWQGYMGYPIIAVLMLQGKIRYSSTVAGHLAGISWKELNQKYKRDYKRVIEQVFKDLQNSGVDVTKIEREIESIYRQLQNLKLKRLPRRRRPPKEKRA